MLVFILSGSLCVKDLRSGLSACESGLFCSLCLVRRKVSGRETRLNWSAGVESLLMLLNLSASLAVPGCVLRPTCFVCDMPRAVQVALLHEQLLVWWLKLVTASCGEGANRLQRCYVHNILVGWIVLKIMYVTCHCLCGHS
jgi:hypothetical protein